MYEDLIVPPSGASSSAPSQPAAPAKSGASVESFVQSYLPLAQKVSERTGVRPEALLGQWGLETGWGKSVIPGTNNLGNIKDFSGRGALATDNMTGSRDAYRRYASAEEFGDDYVGLLSRRYKTALNTESPEQFFTELKRNGYAEDPAYVQKGVNASRMVAGVLGTTVDTPTPSAGKEYYEPVRGAYADLIVPPEPRSFGQAAADVALGAASGVVKGVELMSNVAGADNPVSKGANELSQSLMDMQSPQRKAERQNRAELIRQAEQSGSMWEEVKANVGAFLDAPIETSLNALGTSAPTILMSLIPGLGQANATRLILQGAAGAAQGAGAVKGTIYETVKEKVAADLVAGGMDPKAAAVEAEKVAAGAQAYDSQNGQQIAAGAILGVLAGTSGIEGSIARTGVGQNMGKSVFGRMAIGAMTEALPEGAQGGQERLAGNVALQNEGFDVPTWQGVAGQAAGEAIASMGPGAAFGAIPSAPQIDPALKPVADKAAEPNSPLSKTVMAAEEARVAAGIPTAAEQASATQPVDPMQRLAELEAIGRGTPSRRVIDESGNPLVIPGEPGRFFTAEEKAEYDQLRALRDSTPGMTPEDRQAAEQAAQPAQPEVDEILERTRAIEQTLRTNRGLEALRAQDSPYKVNQFLNDLAKAKSKSTPAAQREQALARIETVAEWLGTNLSEITQQVTPQIREQSGPPTRTEQVGQMITSTPGINAQERDEALQALTAWRSPNLPARTRQAALDRALEIVGRTQAPAGQAAADQKPAVFGDIPPQPGTPEYFIREAERREDGAYQFRSLGYDQEADALLLEAESMREMAASARAGELDADIDADPVAPVEQQTLDQATKGLPRTQIPPAADADAGVDGTALRRKRRGQIAQLAASGYDTVERKGSGFVLRNSKTNQEVALEGMADAQLARNAIKAHIDSLAHTAAASPMNDRLEPTEAQIKAGNYKKSDVIELNGVKVKIENPAGSVRRGVGADGKPWETKMVHHYGEIVGTEGADGDRVDVFIGSRPDSNKVFIIDQVNQDGTFDEHKLVFGAMDEAGARQTYLANYEKGWTGLGAIKEIPQSDLRQWLADHAKKPGAESGMGVIKVTSNGKSYTLRAVPVESLPASSADSPARGAAGAQITRQQGLLLKGIAGFFGKDIVFFSDPQRKIDADGFVQPGDDVTIYLNEKSGISPLAVFGHELMHILKRDNPKAYAAIEAVVRTRVTDPKGFRADYYGKDSDAAKAEGGLSDADVEELISDLNGNLMSDTAFWRDVFAQIERDNGKDARGIIAQLAAFFQRMIDGAVAAFKGAPTFRANRFISDMDAVRAAFRDGLSQYAQGAGITKTALQADILKAQQKLGDIKKSAARPDDGITVEGYHFSKAERRMLSTGFYGTGLQGSDREEIMSHPDMRLRNRLSFYVNKGTGIRPESGVGPIAHKATLTNIYDADADTRRLKQGRNKRAFESAVLNAGYSGYLTRLDGSQPGQVILLGNQTVTPEVLGFRTQIDGAQPVPAMAKRDADLSDKLQALQIPFNGQLTPARWAQVVMARDPELAAQLMDIGALSGDNPMYRDELMTLVRRKTGAPKKSSGLQAAGIVFKAADTGRILMAKRGASVANPGTWSIPGGAVDAGESLESAALREAKEEIGFQGQVKLTRIAEAKFGNATFSTFIATVPSEFSVQLNGENSEAKWVDPDALPDELHPGFRDVKDQVVGAAKSRSLASWSLDGSEIKRSTQRAKDEYAEVEAKYKGTDQWLKAPNGNKTKLTERQWVHVRTPAFKAWFGDWESAAANGGVWADDNVSKVVDENGEPMVVYHGSDKGGFMSFDAPGGTKRGDLGIFTANNWDMARSYVRKNSAGEVEARDEKAAAEEAGVEFYSYQGRTSSKQTEDQQLFGYRTPYGDEVDGYTSEEDAVYDAFAEYVGGDGAGEQPGVYALFLNIRNPSESDFEGAYWNGERPGQYIVVDENGEQIYDDQGHGYFDRDTADLLAQEKGGNVEDAPEHYENTDYVVKQAWRNKNDGAIIRNVVDDGGGPGGYDGEPVDVFVALEPKQIKSADFNNGEYSPVSDDIRFSKKRAQDPADGDKTDVAKLNTGRAIPESAAVGSLEKSLELARSKSYRRGRDLKKDIQDQVIAAAKAARVNLTERTKSTFAFLSRMVYDDAKFALQSNENAVGWYDQKVSRAIGALSTIHPEINNDKRSRLAFLWALATTSNGLKVDKNFELAEAAYKSWKTTGKMPTNIGIGNAAQAINKGMAAYNELAGKVGEERLLKFMGTKFEVGQIERMLDMKVGGEWKNTPVRGAAILGPKIGNGFFSNLNGYFDALTMDRWLMRTWGRMTGTLLQVTKQDIDASRKKLANKIGELSDQERRTMAKLIGHPVKKSMTKAELDAAAKASQKASMKKEKRSVMMSTDAMNEFRKAANLHHMTMDGQKEAPSGPAERNWIRAVFQDSLAKLQADGLNMTMSDLQALLWYPERRLYDAAKSDEDVANGYEDDEAPDYANAALNLAVAQGVDRDKVLAAMDKAEKRGTVQGEQLTDEEKAEMLEQFRSAPPQPMQIVFEVAPDPDNAELTAKWNGLTQKQKEEITEAVRDALVADMAKSMGLTGKIVRSMGGYEGQVNPNLVLEIKKKELTDKQARAFASALGIALDQKSMVVMDGRGDSSVGIVRVKLSEKAEKHAEEVMRLVGAAVPGVDGFSARGNNIDILNFTGMSNEELHSKIVDALEDLDADLDAIVTYGEVKSDLIGKESYDSEIRGLGQEPGQFLLERARATRDRARQFLEQELQRAAVEVPGRAAGARRGDAGRAAAAAGRAEAGAVQDAGGIRRSAGRLAVEGGPDQGNGREADGSLKGLPRDFNVGGIEIRASHWAPAEKVAREYMKRAGLEYQPPAQYAKVNKERAARIAAEYDRMKHDPKNPVVRAAYQALAKETIEQYRAVIDSGLKVEFIDFAATGDPYAASPRLMTEDVRNNNHMWVFSTRDGFGTDASFDPEDNPLLAETEFEISGQKALVNDLFRVVHDYFGHVKEGVGFRADGEENTWRAHSSMFSPLAQRALTTETRGQNSWLNFGPHGEKNRTAKVEDTHFADQKTGLLPLWASEEGRYDEEIKPSKARNPVVDTPEFKAWFKDSKVVDENGDPLVVYHGTTKEFNEFKSSDGLFGWFTSDPNYASNYPSRDSGGVKRDSMVMPAYLRLENPATLDQFQERGGLSRAEKVRELMASGYDGLVSESGKVFVAFSPEQIKSATGNRGTFDPASADITKSAKREPEKRDEVAADEARGRRVSYEVTIEDTGDTASMTVDAGQAIADYDDRIATMKKLLECLKK